MDRGNGDCCARCQGGSTQLVEMLQGVWVFLCLDCVEDFNRFMLEDDAFREFEYLHEVYVIIKRRGISLTEAIVIPDLTGKPRLHHNPNFRKMLDDIFDMRLSLMKRAKAWVAGKINTDSRSTAG